MHTHWVEKLFRICLRKKFTFGVKVMASWHMIDFFYITYEKCSCTMLVTCNYLSVCYVLTVFSPSSMWKEPMESIR
jgi:hypothetical protein